MLRCKWNGLLALIFMLVPVQLLFSRADGFKGNLKPIDIPESTTLKTIPYSIPVSASVYFPEEAQTDDTPFITADGSRINPRNPKKHRWVALSRNLLKRWGGKLDFGDTIQVTGISKKLDGNYIVKDVMHKRIRNRIDLLVGRKDKIMGRWNNVRITPIGQSAANFPVQSYAQTTADW